MYFINYFFIYSFFGYIVEILYDFFRGAKLKSGILKGPVTPIYGFGSLLILFISDYLFKILNLNFFWELIIVLFVIAFSLTFLEFIGGILIEKIFHKTFWNYSNFKFHIGKYIALEVSLVWMLGAILIIYIVNPLINKFIYLIPNFVTYILILLFILDFINLFLNKKKINKI